MDIRTRLEEVAGVAQTWKKDLWIEDGCRDSPASLGWMVKGSEQLEHCDPEVMGMLYRDTGDGDMPSVIYSVLIHKAKDEGFTQFEEIIFMTDSFGYAGSQDEMPESLEQDFLTNPESKVYEQLTVAIAADDLVGGVDYGVAMAPYRIVDGGEMVFDDLIVSTNESKDPIRGSIIEVMEWGIRDAHKR